MDTHHPSTEINTPNPYQEFQPGTSVIYALHGKCTITGIENRDCNGQSMKFYKLELQRSPLSRSTRQEPAIWVPLNQARQKGLRLAISKADVESVQKIFSSREYYFELNMPWLAAQSKMEATVRAEGAVGLAKAASYLFVLLRKQVVPDNTALRFQETVHKLLFRELSEATGDHPRILEERAVKSLRHKLLPDN